MRRKREGRRNGLRPKPAFEETKCTSWKRIYANNYYQFGIYFSIFHLLFGLYYTKSRTLMRCMIVKGDVPAEFTSPMKMNTQKDPLYQRLGAIGEKHVVS
jgi:hypothetical protein